MQTLCMTGNVEKVKDLLEKLTEIESTERKDELPSVIYCVCQQVLAWLIEIINDIAIATDEGKLFKKPIINRTFSGFEFV